MNWLDQARAEIRSWAILEEDWAKNTTRSEELKVFSAGKAEGYRKALDSLKYWERMEKARKEQMEEK